MIEIRNLTVKNFMSVGNATQAINFDRKDLTLVLGENLDLGGDGSRNGTGKCVCINTIVKVRNTKTGEIYETTMGELYNAALEQNLNDNCKEVMRDVIKNINPATEQRLLNDIESANIKNNKKEIESFIRGTLTLQGSAGRHTKKYWIARGWSADEAYVKAKENKQKNISSVYSRELWLNKINPNTQQHYTINEADFERNSRRPIRKEFWIKQGFSEKESIKLASDTKNANNQKGAGSSANSPVRKASSKRCAEYYVARGHTDDEAKALVSKGQKYFSKEICIEKHGLVDGLKIWQTRQDNWQQTLNNKSAEEKDRINRLKLSKGITVSVAERAILSEVKTVFPTAEHQFTLHYSNQKQYVYDIRVSNKIIEYNGDFWHSNPGKYSPDFINPRTKLKAVDKWEQDRIKLKYAQDQGYEVLVIWESEFKKNKEEVLNKCIQFLTQ